MERDSGRKWLAAAALVSGLALAGANARADEVDDAWRLMDAGRVHAAEARLAQALIADPSSFRAWFAMGVARARMHRSEAAIRAFREVIRLRPDLAEAHNNIAVIYYEEGKLDLARKELELAIQLAPDYAVALENRGDLHLREALRDYDKAIRHASKEERARLMARREALASLIEGARGRIRLNGGGSKQAGDAAAGGGAHAPAPAYAAFDTPRHLLETWRRAWERQDIGTFFSCYGRDFRPSGRFRSVEEWRRYKRRVIANKRFIRVRIRHLVMDQPDDRHVRIGFWQEYASDLFSDRVHKLIVAERTDQGWKIMREEVFR